MFNRECPKCKDNFYINLSDNKKFLSCPKCEYKREWTMVDQVLYSIDNVRCRIIHLFYYHFIYRLCRSIRWFIRMWGNEEWDYNFFLKTVEYKLTDMALYWRDSKNKHSVDEWSNQALQEISHARRLIKWLRTNMHELTPAGWKLIKKSKMEFIKRDEGLDWLFGYKLVSNLTAEEEKQLEIERKKASRIYQKRVADLFNTLKKCQGWWD